MRGNDPASSIGFGPGNAGLTNFNGLYVNGSGQFLFGSSSGHRVQFDGDNLIVSASSFYLGGADQYISGSGGNIEISSSNFYLDNSGNVSASNAWLSGTVTADSGEIGG